MFAKDGYLTTTDVLDVLSRYLCTPERRMCKLSDREFWEILYDDFWTFARKQRCCHLISPNGQIFRGSNQLLGTSKSTTGEGTFFYVQIGILGHRYTTWPTGWKSFVWPLFVIDQKLQHFLMGRMDRKYCGDLIGSSVCFTEEQVKAYVEAKAPAGDPSIRAGEESPKTVEDVAALLIEHVPTTEAAAACYIIRLCDEGKLGSKPQVVASLTGKLKKRAVLRAWDRAAEKRPEISRPGRRKTT